MLPAGTVGRAGKASLLKKVGSTEIEETPDSKETIGPETKAYLVVQE